MYSGARSIRADFLRRTLKSADVRKVILLAPTSTISSLRETFLPIASSTDLEIMTFDQLRSADLGDRVILHSLNANLSRGVHIRQRLQRPSWSVAGLTHDLSDPEIYKDLAMVHAAGLRPGDSIFCCSVAAQAAMSAIVDHTQRLLRHPPTPLALPIIPYAIEPTDHPRHGKEVARQQMRLPNESYIFLFFGRLSMLTKADLKGLIELFAKGFSGTDNYLLLSGELSGTIDSAHIEMLKSTVFQLQIQKQVRFVTNPSPTTKQLLFSAADAFVCPANSTQESFGITVLEAMLYELPVVLTDWNGYRDTVVHRETGFLVPTLFAPRLSSLTDEMSIMSDVDRQTCLTNHVVIDFRAFLTAMLELSKRRDLTTQFGTNARRRALEHFGWPLIISEHVNRWIQLSHQSSQNREPLDQRPVFLDYEATFKTHPGSIISSKED